MGRTRTVWVIYSLLASVGSIRSICSVCPTRRSRVEPRTPLTRIGAVPNGMEWSPDDVRTVMVPAGMFIPTRVPRTTAPTGAAADLSAVFDCTVS
jgi:hypothetical protein